MLLQIYVIGLFFTIIGLFVIFYNYFQIYTFDNMLQTFDTTLKANGYYLDYKHVAFVLVFGLFISIILYPILWLIIFDNKT